MILFGLGTFKMLAILLSVELMGAWVAFLSVTSVLEVARAGLIQNGLVRYLSTSEAADYGKISTASLILNLLLTSLSCILLFAVAKPLSIYFDYPQLVTMFYIYVATTTFLIPFQQFNFTQQANLDFKGIFWASFTKQGLFFLAILIFFMSGTALNLITLASIQVFTAVAASFVAFTFTKKYLKFSSKIHWSWVKELFQYGKFTFGTNLSAMLHKNIDKWMLGGLIGRRAIGLYEPCIKVTNIVEVPTFSIASIVFPQSALKSKNGSKKQIKDLYERAVGAIMAFTLPCILFVLLFPKFVITVIASPEYLEASTLLCLTMLYGLFFPFANQFGTILDSIGRPQINFFFVVLGVVLNVFFNYIFITNFGLMGAAYGTLLTYIVTFVLNQIVLHRLFGVQFWKAFGYIPFFYKEALQIIKEKTGQSKPQENKFNQLVD